MAAGQKRPHIEGDAADRPSKQARSSLTAAQPGTRVPRKLQGGPRRKRETIEVRRHTASATAPQRQVWAGSAESPSKPVSSEKSTAGPAPSPANSEATTLLGTPDAKSSISRTSFVSVTPGAVFSPGSPTLRQFGAASFFGTGFTPTLSPTKKAGESGVIPGRNCHMEANRQWQRLRTTSETGGTRMLCHHHLRQPGQRHLSPTATASTATTAMQNSTTTMAPTRTKKMLQVSSVPRRRWQIGPSRR